MEKINYKEIISKYPWIVKKDQLAVISPDADGMICGLFMSEYLNWKIVGYYDNGKSLILQNGLSAKDCIFLDTEIYRKEIKSCGHHINIFRNEENPGNWDWNNFANCLNPNVLKERCFQGKECRNCKSIYHGNKATKIKECEKCKGNQFATLFSLKYPMGTIHLLLCIVGYKKNITFSNDALFSILQADGTINRLIDRHTGNFLNWLEYLGVSDKNNILHKLIHYKKVDLLEFSKQYEKYVQQYVITKKDKIPISDNNGLISDSFNHSQDKFSINCKKQVQEYLTFISSNTGWAYKESKWLWDNFKIYEFTKKSVNPQVRTYKDAVNSNFLSLAITSTDKKGLQYTLEEPDKLP